MKQTSLRPKLQEAATAYREDRADKKARQKQRSQEYKEGLEAKKRPQPGLFNPDKHKLWL